MFQMIEIIMWYKSLNVWGEKGVYSDNYGEAYFCEYEYHEHKIERVMTYFCKNRFQISVLTIGVGPS